MSRIAWSTLIGLVIAGIGFLGWWTWGRHLPVPNAWGTKPVGEEARYPMDPMAIADLGGVKEPYEYLHTLLDVDEMEMLTDDELAVYRQSGAGRAKVAVSRFPNGGKATVLLIRAANSTSAQAAAQGLAELQVGYGFRPVPAATPAVMAAILDGEPETIPGGRAHYAHDDIVTRVEFRGPNVRQTYTQFQEVLRDQLEILPAQ